MGQEESAGRRGPGAAVGLLVLLTLFLLLELTAEGIVWYRTSRYSQTATSFYPFDFEDSEGNDISRFDGSLKLVAHPALIYRHKPNQRQPRFTINSDGYRGPEFVRNDKPLLVMLGGSQAFGTGLESDDETVTAHLERMQPLQTINAGMIGFASGQELVLYVTQLAKLRPAIVVALTGWNDLLALNQPPPSYGMGFNGFAQVEAQLRTAYAVTQQNPLNRYIAGIPRVFFPTLAALLTPRSESLPRANLEVTIDAFAKNESLLAQSVRASGGKFFVALQPDARSVRGDRGSEADRYNTFRIGATERLSSEQVSVIDCNAKDVGLEQSEFMDAVHLNSNGNRKLANFLAHAMDAAPTN